LNTLLLRVVREAVALREAAAVLEVSVLAQVYLLPLEQTMPLLSGLAEQAEPIILSLQRVGLIPYLALLPQRAVVEALITIAPQVLAPQTAVLAAVGPVD
jgi:hypothetical protein